MSSTVWYPPPVQDPRYPPIDPRPVQDPREPAHPVRHGDPRFYALLEEIAELHSRKNHDYAEAEKPLSNFTRARTFGVEPWKGVLVRMSDKWSRIEQLASGKTPKNESLRDSLIDLAVYALLCVLLREDA